MFVIKQARCRVHTDKKQALGGNMFGGLCKPGMAQKGASCVPMKTDISSAGSDLWAHSTLFEAAPTTFFSGRSSGVEAYQQAVP